MSNSYSNNMCVLYVQQNVTKDLVIESSSCLALTVVSKESTSLYRNMFF